MGCICDAVPVPITAAKETPLRGRAQPFGFHSFFHFRSLLFTIPLKAARSRPFAAQGSKLQKGLQAAYVGLAPSCTFGLDTSAMPFPQTSVAGGLTGPEGGFTPARCLALPFPSLSSASLSNPKLLASLRPAPSCIVWLSCRAPSCSSCRSLAAGLQGHGSKLH